MSLRARLALFYTTIVGGILLLFGVAVYGVVSFSLTEQVDNILVRAVDQIWPDIHVDSSGNLGFQPDSAQELAPGILFQVWGRDKSIKYTNAPQLGASLDPLGLNVNQPVFRDSTLRTSLGPVHLRTLTVPLVVGDSGRSVGLLQVATTMSVVDATQRSLLNVLVIGAVIAMAIAGLAGWISTKQALARLGDVTQVALQITRADDLSRRIPYSGPADDEVGQLIHAFNQTLSRLENLFNSQRRFLADVGHELRTPLTVIKGNVDLMRRIGCIDDESMEGIESEVDRLTRMVGDLLLLAQAESGKLPLDRRLVELDTLLLEVMQQMRVLTKDRLQMKLGDLDQVLVCGDKDRLKQVVVNLIGNAIKYTPAGGEVVVSLGKDDSRGYLAVRDNGPGIPEEDLPHIFERFYRGEKARTRQRDGKGFGLGLSIAYWIVRNHGGEIEVASSKELGTTFTVWLPLAKGDCSEELDEPNLSSALNPTSPQSGERWDE
jgi:two-component system OmpR family sensor kinase